MNKLRLIIALLAIATVTTFSACGGGSGSGSGKEQGETDPGTTEPGSENPGTTNPGGTVTKSSNADLSAINLSEGSLSPGFSADVTEYTVTVSHSTEQINIEAATSDDKAVYSITSQMPSSLVVGDNDFTIAVTAEDGTEKHYSVNVVRAASSAKSILEFKINGLAVGVVNEADKTIAVTLPDNIDHSRLVPIVVQTGASVLPASGTPQELHDGAQYTVTAADGSTQVYQLQVSITHANNSTDFTYETLAENSLKILKYTGSSLDVIIPRQINGANVTQIGEYFLIETGSDENTTIQSVVIPDTVTTITQYAFRYSIGLKSVYMPDSVTTIEGSAFSKCSSLTSIQLSDNLTIIEGFVFSECSELTSIDIPDSVTTIKGSAFSKCRSLTSIHFPDSLTVIQDRAFEYCTGLISIDIPDSVTYIDSSAFENCSGLTSVDLPDSLNTLKSRAFYNCSSLTAIKIPGSLTTIDSSTFYQCYNLQSIELPASLTNLKEFAFDRCFNLENIVIHASTPPSLERDVFRDTVAGRKIAVPAASLGAYKSSWSDYQDDIVPIKNTPTIIFDSGSDEASGFIESVSGQSGTDISLPANTFTRSGYVFVGWSIKPKGVICAFDKAAFTLPYYDRTLYACWQNENAAAGSDFQFVESPFYIMVDKYEGTATNLVVPEYHNGKPVTQLDYSFLEYSVTSVSLPETISMVSQNAIYNCSSLESVYLPSTITKIGRSGIAACTNLTSIYINAEDPPELGDYVFGSCPNISHIYVPMGSVDAYKNASGWSAYADKIVAQ